MQVQSIGIGALGLNTSVPPGPLRSWDYRDAHSVLDSVITRNAAYTVEDL